MPTTLYDIYKQAGNCIILTEVEKKKKPSVWIFLNDPHSVTSFQSMGQHGYLTGQAKKVYEVMRNGGQRRT